MNRTPCSLEAALLAHMASGVSDGAVGSAGPVDEDLQRHLGACASCRDTMAIVRALRHDDRLAASDRAVPTASHVWWRARVRARVEAAQAVDRPISVVQSISIAALLGLAVSLVGLQPLRGWLRHIRDVVSHFAGADVATTLSAVLHGGPLWLMLVAGVCLAVLMPVAAAIAWPRD